MPKDALAAVGTGGGVRGSGLGVTILQKKGQNPVRAAKNTHWLLAKKAPECWEQERRPQRIKHTRNPPRS